MLASFDMYHIAMLIVAISLTSLGLCVFTMVKVSEWLKEYEEQAEQARIYRLREQARIWDRTTELDKQDQHLGAITHEADKILMEHVEKLEGDMKRVIETTCIHHDTFSAILHPRRTTRPKSSRRKAK